MNDEVAIQVQRNKVLIEEEQVELSLVDENVDVEHFFCNDACMALSPGSCGFESMSINFVQALFS